MRTLLHLAEFSTLTLMRKQTTAVMHYGTLNPNPSVYPIIELF